MKKFFLALALAFSFSSGALAQSTCPPFTYHEVLTPGQWQACFDAKQSVIGYTPLNKAGDTMLGRLVTTAPGANTAGLNLTPGTTPDNPVNGDIWNTTAGFFVRVNGVTVGPLTGGASSSFAAVSPLHLAFPSGVVTYSFDFTVANTFLAAQTDQGATTTSPGWYVSLAGDTTPRARFGLNATDVPSLAFGPGNAVRDTFIERAGAANIRHGSPDAAAPVAQTISVQNVIAGTSNTAGVALTIAGSRGTGTGIGGDIQLQAGLPGSTGSAQNALTNIVKLSGGTGALLWNTDNTYDIGAAGATRPRNIYAGGIGTFNSLSLATSITVTNIVAPSTPASGSTVIYVDSTQKLLAAKNDAGTISITVFPTSAGSHQFGTGIGGNGIPTFAQPACADISNAGTACTANTGTSGATIPLLNGNNTWSGTNAFAVMSATSLALGGATIGTNALAITGTAAISSTLTSAAHAITSASANALVVGLNGSTNPALQIDASTALSATGIKIKSAAAAAGVAVSVITSGTNENLTLDAAGSGTITLGGTSTGAIIHTRTTTLSAALTYGGVTLNNAVSGTGNMALTAGTTFTGTTTTATLVATTLNGNTFTTGTYTLTGTAAKTLNFTNSITLSGTDSTTWTGPSTNATLAALNIASQTVTGGFINTPANLGTLSGSSTTTLNCGTNQLQFYTNGGAHTLAAPANDGQCIIRSLNNGSAGAITFTGFTNGSNVGDTLNTGNGNAFAIQVWRINGVSRYLVSAYQ